MPPNAAEPRRTSSFHRHNGRPKRRRTRYSYLFGALAAFLGLAALLGTAFGATGTPAPPPADPNANCTLTVPANPLSAQGLATPYLLSATDPRQGPCHEADTAQSAFVQATVVDPATGALSVYDPLVIDKGSRPAKAPVRPRLPAHGVVGIWFGFNADTLTLRGSNGSLSAGKCVNGLGNSLFTQFAYCNAPAFFRAANTAEASGRLVVPPLGTGTDGKACMSTRDFGLIDQDQSDNVTTDYLATADGRTAQKTAADTAALPGATSLLNGSDNLLLVGFVDPALGCTPYTAPDLADPGQRVTSLGLDEIQAARFQAAPIALVPVNDPMAQVDGKTSRAKTNLYRAGVDMPALGGKDQGDPIAYCTSLMTTGAQRINDDQQFFAGAMSPDDGTNLFDFLTARLAASLTNLNCPAADDPSATASASASATATASATSSASAPVGPTADPTTAPATSAPATVPPTATASAPAMGTTAPAATTAPPTQIGMPATSPAVQVGYPATSPPAAAPPTKAAPMTVPPTTAPPTTAPPTDPADAGSATPSAAVVQVHDAVPGPAAARAVLGGATVPATTGTPASTPPTPPASSAASRVGLADTGASGSLMPYVGLAVSLLLFGLSAFFLVGRREPVRRSR